MKKFLSLMLVFVMVFALAACGSKDGGEDAKTDGAIDYDKISDTMESEDGKYELAFVTDVGQLRDGSFNQFTWNGVKAYAYENDLSYKYYQPANGNQATDADRYDAMKNAADAGAKIIVAAGFLQEKAIRDAAKAYPDVHFIFIDGSIEGVDNIASVVYKEEQAGYLAGYAAAMEGFEKIGFSGGGGGSNPACERYGYGFVQGVEAGAAEKGTKVEMRYSWEYGSTFSASQDLQAMLSGWYEAGTEVVFMCGGSMFQSGTAAAGANDAYVIGVDVDQSGQSDTVITSAMKDLAGSTMDVIKGDYDGKWSDFGGKVTTFGAAEDRVGIPTDTWKLENWTVEDYNALYEKVKSGEIEISSELVSDPSTLEWENISFIK